MADHYYADQISYTDAMSHEYTARMLSLANSKRPKAMPVDQDFEDLKPMMEELYVKQNMSQKQVSQIMEAQYGLKATKHRYEKAFRNWNWSKNMPSQFWDAVCLNLYRLKDHGGKLEVFYNGDKVEDERVRREMRRRPASFFRSRGAASNILPPGLVILARTDRTSTLFLQLPFHTFEACVTTSDQMDFGSWSATDAPFNVTGKIVYPHSSPYSQTLLGDTSNSNINPITTRSSASSFIESLETVALPVLSSIQLSKSLVSRLGAHVEMTKYHWQTLLSISNNFAGLAGLDAPKFFRFLTNELSRSFTSMIRHTSNCHSMQSLVYNIMRASIGMGDATIVDAILSYGNGAVDANNLVCFDRGNPCTALEKAMFLLHLDVVRVLLHHGAKIQTTRSKQEPYQIHNIVDSLIKRQTLGGQRLKFEMLSILLKAGCECTCSSLIYLIERQQSDLVQSLIEANRVIDIKNYFVAGVLHKALMHLDECACIRLLNSLGVANSDVDIALETWKFRVSFVDLESLEGIESRDQLFGKRPLTLLDTAVKKGYISIVKKLLLIGATISRFTLGDAITSRSEELVMLLLNHGARFEDVHSDEMRHPFELLQSKFLSDHDPIHQPLSLVEELPDNHNKGYFLMLAAKEGLNEEAERLIDSDIDLDFTAGEHHGPPLYEALKRRNATLVCSLLDAGADPNYFSHKACTKPHTRVPALTLAVHWGDCTIVQHLLDAGAFLEHACANPDPTPLPYSLHDPVISLLDRSCLSPALHIAVQNSNKELVILLLRSSPAVGSSVWRSVIQAATRNNDMEMVQLLILWGARITSDLKYDSQTFDRLDQPYILLFGSKDLRLVVDSNMSYSLNRETSANAETFDRTEQDDLPPSYVSHAWKSDKTVRFGKTTEYLIKAGEEAEDPFLRDLYKKIKNAWEDYHRQQLDLTQCDPEIRDLIMDAHKLICPSFYQAQILGNLARLMWSTEHDLFTNFISRNFSTDTIYTRIPELSIIYYNAIMRAKYGDIFFVKTLLEHGCSPEALMKDHECDGYDTKLHMTAFLYAVASGKADIVKLFVEHGADINLAPRLSVKRTPLQQAATCGCLNIVHLLITLGAHVNAPAARFGGATALQFAAIGGYNAIISLLISYGADVNAPAAKVNGRTALEGAAEHGRLDTVKVLLNAGAAHNGQDRAEMESAIRYADEKGHPYISDLLKEYLENGEIKFDVPRADPEPFDDMFDWDRWDENVTSIE